jgi:hypothetical protein
MQLSNALRVPRRVRDRDADSHAPAADWRIASTSFSGALAAPMSPLEDVRKLIQRLSPDPICDGCVAERLGLSARQHANHLARELAGRDHVERRKDICSLCFKEKLVTRRLRV